jgi:hypothetical protein
MSYHGGRDWRKEIYIPRAGGALRWDVSVVYVHQFLSYLPEGLPRAFCSSYFFFRSLEEQANAPKGGLKKFGTHITYRMQHSWGILVSDAIEYHNGERISSQPDIHSHHACRDDEGVKPKQYATNQKLKKVRDTRNTNREGNWSSGHTMRPELGLEVP